jgi:hypothetical protein
MSAITRRRIAAAAGVLTLSGLLGAAVAVPGPWQDGKTAMTHQATPHPWDSAKLASVPGPWDDGVKLAMQYEGTPRPWDSIQLTSVQQSVPPPYEDG